MCIIIRIAVYCYDFSDQYVDVCVCVCVAMRLGSLLAWLGRSEKLMGYGEVHGRARQLLCWLTGSCRALTPRTTHGTGAGARGGRRQSVPRSAHGLLRCCIISPSHGTYVIAKLSRTPVNRLVQKCRFSISRLRPALSPLSRHPSSRLTHPMQNGPRALHSILAHRFLPQV